MGDWDGSNIAFISDNNINNNSSADNVVVDDPDQEELQNLLLDLNDDDFPSPTFSNNTEVNDHGESFPLESLPAVTTSMEETDKNFSRENIDFENKSNGTTTSAYAAPSMAPTSSLSKTATQNTVSPDHAREARRQRMEIILRRRGLLGKLSNSRARREQNNAAAEHAVKALLSSNTNVKMEDVQNIANQLVMNMNMSLTSTSALQMTAPSAEQITMPRSVSFADGSELGVRPPSPVLSAAAVKPVTKRNSRRSRGDFPVPDETTSSFTPTSRASSVPPRKKAPLNSSRSRKKTSASECTVDPTLLPDGDDPESRRQRRLIRNRMSAQLHRERKREAMDALQRMIQERDLQIQTLEQQLTQIHKKNSSLEDALSVIRSHFGAQAVENLVNTPPASPPHLVNNSDSSSSDDDENSTSSAPSSPISPSMSMYSTNADDTDNNTKKRSSVLLPAGKSNKKKKLMNAVMMAPLCVCAIIGCLSVIPFKQNSLKTQKHVLESPSYRQRINPPFNEVDDLTDARRRLLSVKSVTGDTDSLLDQILGEASTSSSSANQLQEWVINPIENYPAQWNVNHALKYPTPWSYSSHELLFDFRSHALSKTMRSYDFLNSKNNQDNIIKEKMTSTTTSKLRGSASNHHDANNSTTTTTTTQEILEKETSLVSLSKAIAISNAVSSDDHSNDSTHDDTSIGASSNYLFCPSAHAKFTPEFLKISKFGRDLLTEEDLKESNNNAVDDPLVESEEIDVRDEENKNNFPHEEEKDHTQSSPVSHALVPANTFAQNKIIKDDKFIYKAALEGDDPYMSILLPASAVSGGTVTPRRDEPWIELGCQVLSAKIVNGVDFLEADKENITS